MRLSNVVKPAYLILIFLQPLTICAQNFVKDTAMETAAFQNAIKIYHQSLSPEAGLFNGSEYAYNVHYPFIINQGDPYFQSKFDTGSVFYNKVLYTDVPLLYDIVMNELVTRDPMNIYNIKLNDEKVGWFTIYNQTFYRLRRDSGANASFKTGFYALVYDGKIPLFKKVYKKIKENSANSQGINKYVVSFEEYFIQKAGVFYSVKNKQDLLLVMNDRKKAVEQFIKERHFNFRKDLPHALEEVLRFYNTSQNLN